MPSFGKLEADRPTDSERAEVGSGLRALRAVEPRGMERAELGVARGVPKMGGEVDWGGSAAI